MATLEQKEQFKACIKSHFIAIEQWIGQNKNELCALLGINPGTRFPSIEAMQNHTLQHIEGTTGAQQNIKNLRKEIKEADIEDKLYPDKCFTKLGKIVDDSVTLSKVSPIINAPSNNTIKGPETTYIITIGNITNSYSQITNSEGTPIIYEISEADEAWGDREDSYNLASYCGVIVPPHDEL